MFPGLSMQNKSQKQDENSISSSNQFGHQNPAQLRLQKELQHLDELPSNIELIFTDPNKILEFQVRIKIIEEDSYWHGACYTFAVNVPLNYPIEPPKCKCLTKIYHPNIDLEGNVCLNILRKDWRPILSIKVVIFGLLILFNEPNGDDPLNLVAGKVFRENKEQFIKNVKQSLNGIPIDGVSFPKLINF